MKKRYLITIFVALSLLAMLGLGDSAIAHVVHAFPGISGSAIGLVVAGVSSFIGLA